MIKLLSKLHQPVHTVIALILLGIIAVGGIASIFLLNAQRLTPPPPAGYSLYKDPDGYFTMNIPTSWSIKRDKGLVKSNSKGHELDYPSVLTSFMSDPNYAHPNS